MPLYMVGLSILLAWAFNRGTEVIGVSLPWWVDAPSVVSFYGVVYFAFERHIWRASVMHRLGIVKVPNLNGTWAGTVAPSSEEHTAEHPVTVEIAQNWQSICIQLRTDNSGSHSVIGAVVVEEAEEAVLNYEYINEPRAHAVGSMHMHRGTARLRLIEGGDVLEGEYYTGRDRKSHGTLRVKWQSSSKDRTST